MLDWVEDVFVWDWDSVPTCRMVWPGVSKNMLWVYAVSNWDFGLCDLVELCIASRYGFFCLLE